MTYIRVNKCDYDKKPGLFIDHTILSEYSVSINRDVLYDRSNARYLVDENIRADVNFDLKIGLRSFVKAALLQDEPCLHGLCRWAVGREGASVREVFGGAEIVSWRGTLKRIANTLVTYNPHNPPRHEDAWTAVAQSLSGVVFISEQSKVYAYNDLDTFSGFKFEQYVTTATPNGRPNTDTPVDNRPTFEMMVCTDLVVGRDSLRICCGAEIDAMRGDEPVEIKTAWEGKENGFFRNVSTVMQSEIAGVKSVVIGIKKGDYIVNRVIERSIDDIRNSGNIGKWERKANMGYSFLFTVLREIRKLLVDNEAVEASFNPSRGAIEINTISRQRANENGNGVTEEFKKRFGL